MSLILALVSAERALLLGDSAASDRHGIVRVDQPKQFLLPGCVALQVGGDVECCRWVRELAHRTPPLPLMAYVGIVAHAAKSVPFPPDQRPEDGRAFHLVGLDQHGRLKAVVVDISQGAGPDPFLRRADWSADQPPPCVIINSGSHRLPRETVEARQEAIARLPWTEAEAAARALFAEMAASNPQFIGGPRAELHMAAADCVVAGRSGTEVSDGPSTYQRCAVLSVDANRRALIDFTQAAHLDKNLANIADDPAGVWVRLANVGSGNATITQVTLGPSGSPQMQIAGGAITLSTGGASAYQIKKTLYTGATGLEANGTVISFANLKDQAGNALPTFDVPPLVALTPYNMSTPPVLLYASGMTTTGFTLNSYSAATTGTSASINLPNNAAEAYTAPAGDTITGCEVTVSITTDNVQTNPPVVQVVQVSNNGTGIGTVTVNGKATGGTYQTSASFSITGNPTSASLEASWTLASNVASVTASVTVTYISGETAVSANVTCAISEQWS